MVKKMSLLNGAVVTLIAMFGARFFDPSFTFIERGVSFLVLGLVVLGINAIYLWRKGQQRSVANQRIRQVQHQVEALPASDMDVVHSQEMSPSAADTGEVTRKEDL